MHLIQGVRYTMKFILNHNYLGTKIAKQSFFEICSENDCLAIFNLNIY